MRHILLASALLLSAGAVFAQETEAEATPVKKSSLFEINDLKDGDNNTTGYDWNTQTAKQGNGSYSFSAQIVRYDDKTDWSYTAFDKNNPEGVNSWELSVTKDDEGNISGKYLVGYHDADYTYQVPVKDKDGKNVFKEVSVEVGEGEEPKTELKQQFKELTKTQRVYYFSLPVADSVVVPMVDGDNNPIYEQLMDEDGNPVFDEDDNPVYLQDENGDYIQKTMVQAVNPVKELAVKTNGTDGDRVSTSNIAQKLEVEMFYKVNDKVLAYGVAAGTDAEDNPIAKKDADIAFGQPLPSPVATLLIALGFGAAFMMYRNRKQAKA